MNRSISRKLIEKFISQKRLHNIVGFLEYLKSPKNVGGFYDYVKKHSRKISIIGTLPSQILFHGSQNDIEQLIISRKEKLIYATDNPNYAVFLAVLNLRNATAGVLIKKDIAELTIDLAFVNGLSSLKNGWVHIVSAQSFKKIENHEYISNQSAIVLFSIPVTPSDLTVSVNVRL